MFCVLPAVMISNLWLLIQSSLPRFVTHISRQKKWIFSFKQFMLKLARWRHLVSTKHNKPGAGWFKYVQLSKLKKRWKSKLAWICAQKYFLKSLSSSGVDLLASLIGFSDIRLIFKKHPIPRKPRRLRWPEAILNSSAVSACYNKLSGKIVSKLLLCSLESWDWSKQCCLTNKWTF